MCSRYRCTDSCAVVVCRFRRPSVSAVNPFHIQNYHWRSPNVVQRISSDNAEAASPDMLHEVPDAARDPVFPPIPHTKANLAGFARAFADAITGEKLYEGVCGCCGQINILADMKELPLDSAHESPVPSV